MADPRQPRAPEEDTHLADRPPYPGTPGWVKVSGIIVIVLVLLVVIIIFTGVGGGHGPWRHTGGGDTAPAAVTDQGTSGAPGGHTPPIAHGS